MTGLSCASPEIVTICTVGRKVCVNSAKILPKAWKSKDMNVHVVWCLTYSQGINAFLMVSTQSMPKSSNMEALSSWNCVPRHQTKQSVATISSRTGLLASRVKNEKWIIPKSFPVSRSHYDVYRTAFGNLLIWFAVQRNWLFHERCKNIVFGNVAADFYQTLEKTQNLQVGPRTDTCYFTYPMKWLLIIMLW